jgi:hypothetical protein
VRLSVKLLGFSLLTCCLQSALAAEAVVQSDQAYACTSLIPQPDSLNYVERLFAHDGTYIFAWSRSESIKNAIEQQRNEHGEWLSFGRWKVIPTANGGSTLEVSEDIRYHYLDRSWHLPSESARPAFIVESVSIGASASRLATDMQPKRRGEAVPTSTNGSGFTSTVKGQDYFTCFLRPPLTSDKQELLRNVMPKAIEAKNALEQKVANRRQQALARDTEQRQRYPGMSARQIAEQEMMRLQQRIAVYESRSVPPQCQWIYNSMTGYYRSALESMAWAEKTRTDSMFKTASTTARLGVDLSTQGCP